MIRASSLNCAWYIFTSTFPISSSMDLTSGNSLIATVKKHSMLTSLNLNGIETKIANITCRYGHVHLDRLLSILYNPVYFQLWAFWRGWRPKKLSTCGVNWGSIYLCVWQLPERRQQSANVCNFQGFAIIKQTDPVVIREKVLFKVW